MRGPGVGIHRFGGPAERAKDARGTLRRLVACLRPHRTQLGLVFGCAVLSTAFAIVSPRVMGRATTELFRGLMARMHGLPGAEIDFPYLRSVLLALLGLYAASALLHYAQDWVMAGVTQRTVYRLRQDLSQKLTRLPLRFFDQRTHGEVLSRVTNDIETIGTTLQQTLVQVVTASVTLVGILAMMLSISPAMTLVTMVTLPLSSVITVVIARRSQRYFAGQQKAIGELSGHVEEMFAGHRIIRAYGREAASAERFGVHNRQLYEMGWRAQFISGAIMPLMHLVGNLGYVIVSVMGGLLVTGARLALGDVQAFIQYARMFSHPIVQTASIANIIQSTIAAAERVFAVLDEPEEPPDAVQPALEGDGGGAGGGEVAFRGVSFRYLPGVPLIEDFNLQVRRGQKIAIVGPTGAGKTTLVNLLMRFYDVDRGRIEVDGVDIRELRRGHLRRRFGMVLQDAWLFGGTIYDNIAYGRPGASEAEVVAAAQAAHADHFIRTLPGGYGARLNEDGANISQGQMQLLTIARAFLADPAILILDEATSSVDTRTEMLIQAAMHRLMQGRTSFVVAHRLSTIRAADLILVMDGGRIVEQGTHDRLLAAGGPYAELYHSQFAGVPTRPAAAGGG